MTADVTILIPHFNNHPDLRIAVESCRQFPVLIVDDGSNEYNLGSFPANVSEISLKENMGVANARNVLLRNCETRFGVFLDSDDNFVDLDYISEAIDTMKKLGAVVAGCNAILSTGKKQTRPKKIHKLYFLWRDPIITSGAIFSVEEIKHLTFSDPTNERNFAEDYFFWAKVRSTFKMINIDRYAVKRKVRNSSILGSISLTRRIKAALMVRIQIAKYYLNAR